METVTFALTPHTSAIIVQRRRYVDAILRPMETKKQLRSRVLARRDALPEEVRARKSAAICARLEQVLAEALAGAEFTITRISGLPSHGGSQDGEVAAVMTTDAEGKVISPMLTYGT